MRQHMPQSQNNQAAPLGRLSIRPCLRTYGQIPQMGAAHASAAAQLCLNYGKEIYHTSY
jgi:hypothetical protein